MFGLEEKPGKKKKPFVFDLEEEIKQHPDRGEEILAKVEKKIQGLKKTLREGANEKDFDQLGILLQGYAALQKVLRKVK